MDDIEEEVSNSANKLNNIQVRDGKVQVNMQM